MSILIFWKVIPLIVENTTVFILTLTIAGKEENMLKKYAHHLFQQEIKLKETMSQFNVKFNSWDGQKASQQLELYKKEYFSQK